MILAPIVLVAQGAPTYLTPPKPILEAALAPWWTNVRPTMPSPDGKRALVVDGVLDGFLNRCRWVEVFYAWRPNLPDEADNHLIELAVAAQAVTIVTRNLRDVSRGELKFSSLNVLTPEQCLEAFPCPP